MCCMSLIQAEWVLVAKSLALLSKLSPSVLGLFDFLARIFKLGIVFHRYPCIYV
jgi:hypothetical protein